MVANAGVIQLYLPLPPTQRASERGRLQEPLQFLQSGSTQHSLSLRPVTAHPSLALPENISRNPEVTRGTGTSAEQKLQGSSEDKTWCEHMI